MAVQPEPWIIIFVCNITINGKGSLSAGVELKKSLSSSYLYVLNDKYLFIFAIYSSVYTCLIDLMIVHTWQDKQLAVSR